MPLKKMIDAGTIGVESLFLTNRCPLLHHSLIGTLYAVG